MELTGTVLYVNNEVTPLESKPDLKTRSFAIDTSTEVNGQLYPGYASFQTIGENNKKLDALEIGDKVKVDFSIRGNRKGKPNEANPSPKNTTNDIVYTSLNAYGITVLEKKITSQGSENVATTITVTATEKPKRQKPNVIPEGYIWNESTCTLEEDVPF